VTHPARRIVFVDTSALFAASTRRDDNHGTARRVFRRLADERWRLVTTTYVVAETHGLFLNRIGREAGVAFLRSLEGGAVRIDRPGEVDERAAREIIYRYTDKVFSLTDAISFVVMERMGISVAFTFDRDFERYGFAAVQA
jgi:predicted nucleic acid-binding protein